MTRTPPGRSAVLTESRLLTVDEGAVEVAHEALLREWPRLRGWLEEDAEGRRLHQHLIRAAAGVARLRARSRRALPRRSARRGARLGREHDPELNELERDFLDESRAASEREAERQRRANRRLRTLLAGVGVLLAAAVVAGVIALSERQGARSAATRRDAQRLGAQAITEERLDRALCSQTPASPSTTRSRPAPACSRRCCATPRCSASCAATATAAARSR